VEDKKWTERYHARRHEDLAFGGRITIRMKDGREIADELAVANAHPLGATPWQRADYIGKFRTMTDGLITAAESRRFLEACERLPTLEAGELFELNVAMPQGSVTEGKPGLF
jgi:2-methylcitrate dehydratase